MPSLPEAFSCERDDILGAGQAWALSRAADGLRDARAFRCPGTECQAQATLINFGRSREAITVTPHFRVNDAHGVFCPYADEDSDALRPLEDFQRAVDADRPDTSDLPDYANLGSAPLPTGSGAAAHTRTGATPQPRQYDLRLSSMGGIVAHFAALRRSDQQHEKTLSLSGISKSYAHWFVAVFRGLGRVRRQGDAPAIYWGKAWVNRTRKDDGYLLSFITGPKDDQLFACKLFLTDADFSASERGRRQLERLQLIRDAGQPGYIFAHVAFEEQGADGTALFARVFNPQAIEVQKLGLWRALNAPEESGEA